VFGAEDALAEIALLVGLGDRRVQDVCLVAVLAADVYEGAVDLGRPRRDDDPLDQRMGALLHDLAILERPRL
jgi:hypothetical protein